MDVFLERCASYDGRRIDKILSDWEPLFRNRIYSGQTVVLKPNWLSHSHKYDENEWEAVITHPAVITSILKKVLQCLEGHGKVIITDAPQTQSSWKKIMARMTPEVWMEMGAKSGVEIELLDLRDDEWTTKGDVIIKREKLGGDSLGSTECDLNEFSEFVTHSPSKKGYYGADYDLSETNLAHSNGYHRYRVSRSVVSADVFINIPKMKTHKKAGITCSLKNLVGINTYKNWLPHHSEGTPDEGGDQFPRSNIKSKFEGLLFEQFISVLWSHKSLGKWLVPVKGLGRAVFGDTREVIRSGNWFGNDTIWRMILDLNKLLLYADPDGTLRGDKFENRKSYISVVDGIISGEGNGPEAPDAKQTGLLIAGTNPVAVDTVCAKLMGFDWQKIPSIRNSFLISHYPICDFKYEDIVINSTSPQFNETLTNVSEKALFRFTPHFGWENHIELDRPSL